LWQLKPVQVSLTSFLPFLLLFFHALGTFTSCALTASNVVDHYCKSLSFWSGYVVLASFASILLPLLMICTLLPFWHWFPCIVQVANIGTFWLRALQNQVIVVSLVMEP
jgi:hypothetical protein